jgi:hypothetical protein
MKLPKVLLSAILVGVTVQASSCQKGKDPAPKDAEKGIAKTPVGCPGCGLG